MTTEQTNTQIDVESFRLEARAWIEANLEPRTHGVLAGRAGQAWVPN